LDDWQWSIRHRVPIPVWDLMQVSFFYGMRILTLGEQMDYRSVSQSPAVLGSEANVGVRTNNRLLGAQLGALVEFHVEPRWWFDVRMNAALCGNDTEQTTTHTLVSGGAGHTVSFGRGADSSAYVAEVALSCRYYITEHVMVRFGYQMLWIGGLSLASENLPDSADTLNQGPAVLDHDGEVLYHGPHLGVAVQW
jgi:hypothetical protein